MLEKTGDMFEERASAICITTNGFIKANGALVMGAGCAKTARDMWPGLDLMFGGMVKEGGNHVHVLEPQRDNEACLATFPVKPKGTKQNPGWRQKAKLSLIERSTKELVAIADERDWCRVCLPRPGCGNGGLSWRAVKPLIEPLLDDRFVVMTLPRR